MEAIVIEKWGIIRASKKDGTRTFWIKSKIRGRPIDERVIPD